MEQHSKEHSTAPSSTAPEEKTSQLDNNLKPLNELSTHPKNSLIYGADEEVSDLVSLIEQSGWVKPLVVTLEGRIISGHRRYKALQQLGWEEVPVEIRHFENETQELEALLLENASRDKSIEQKVREGKAWEEVEREKARLRKIATQNNNSARADSANLRYQEKGRTSEIVAKKIGMKARNYEKAAKVLDTIDATADETKSRILRQLLNEQSVDAAYQVVKLEENERHRVLEKIATGEAKTVKDAKAMVWTEDSSSPPKSVKAETDAKGEELDLALGVKFGEETVFPSIEHMRPLAKIFCAMIKEYFFV